MTGRLAGKVAVVTGSTSGIGEAVARRFAAEGCSVVVNSSSSVSAGNAIASALPDSLYIQGDISKASDCEKLIAATVARYGKLDILVNNAGTTEVIPHDDLDGATDEIWTRILDVNVVGTWRLSKIAMPHLAESGAGAIVNITSIAGIRPIGSSIPYAVSKAALNHMTTLLARVVGPDVRVNAVAPGLIDTPWTEDWDDLRTNVQRRAPAQRSGKPDEVAEACVHMALAEYMTGQVVAVDGGLTIVV